MLEPAPNIPAPDAEASRLKKRSLRVAGHSTSVSLETVFWDALGAIARRRGVSLDALATEVDQVRHGNLSSALRVFAMQDALALVDSIT